jgi:hypothetical protein
LGSSPFEADVRDNLLGFVDGDVFNQQAYRTFTLSRCDLGIIPELAKPCWHLLDVRTFFRPYSLLITLIVALFNGTCFL